MSMTNDFYISTEKTKLDVDMIVNFLSNESYWAKSRSKAIIEKSIKNSLCFGVFNKKNHQVGFARVVTDFAVFAWLLDVFILEDYRGNGLGKLLIKEILSNDDLKEVKRWGLGTNDAHGLYEKFGFASLSLPERMMERITK